MSWAHTYPHRCSFSIHLHLRLKQRACESWRTQAELRKSCPSSSALSGISSWLFWPLQTSPKLSQNCVERNCSKTLPSLKVPGMRGSLVPCEGLGQATEQTRRAQETPSPFPRGCRSDPPNQGWLGPRQPSALAPPLCPPPPRPWWPAPAETSWRGFQKGWIRPLSPLTAGGSQKDWPR